MIGRPDDTPEEQAKRRLGEKRTMNCGLEAEIIRYGAYADIDVRFEDGYIARHAAYKEFLNGSIRPPIDRVGETGIMNNGLKATIIAYRKHIDMDVLFEDGSVAEHIDYKNFTEGRVARPQDSRRNRGKFRIGEKRIMKCGMEATIIRYNRCDNINVRFEDGSMVEHKAYSAFKKGEIANPNMKASAENRLGETRMMKCGMEATIIRYENATDIDVRFKDGTVVKNRRYSAFKKGEIANPDIKTFAKARLGETRVMNCGMKATIIRYGNAMDIDVRFGDGTIVKNRTYSAFKKGGMVNPNFNPRLGETNMMNCGMEATIIRYNTCKDFDVRFEDGAIATCKDYKRFRKGGIAHPSTTAEGRLGETRMMSCGMKATIIRYENADDINICFEDGKVVEHKTYRAFKKGYIAHQNTNVPVEARLGETQMMNCGMEATIIRYGNNTDIDVCFEDGAIVEHKAYDAFKKGGIAHRSLSLSHGSKDFHGFICKQGFKDKDRVLYKCICKHCGLEDVLTPQEMIEHEKLEHEKNK